VSSTDRLCSLCSFPFLSFPLRLLAAAAAMHCWLEKGPTVLAGIYIDSWLELCRGMLL
jgi:hypothetical protein